MAYVVAAVEIPEIALFFLRKLRRPVPDVLWFDPVDGGDVLAPFRRSWFDEWGYLPLAWGSLDDAGAERFDSALQNIRLPEAAFAISRLTFLTDPEPYRICARIDPSPTLTQLASECQRAIRGAGADVESPRFEPLVPLANCRGATREELTSYAREVEPFPPIKVQCDRFVMCSKATGPAAGSIQVRMKIDYEYGLG